MSIVKKVVALASAAALASSGLLLVGLAAPTAAQAAGQTMTITPAGPYKGGEKVTVSVKGFSPNAPVALGLCKKGRVASGPGDCAASKTGASRLIQANAQGEGTGAITMVVGSIGNSKPPADSCGPKNPCVMGAANITNAKEAVNTNVAYVGATTTKKTTTAPKTTTTAPKTTTTAPNTTATTPQSLPKTGPKETLIIGLLGLALFQIGLIFAVRAVRSSPRRMSI